MTDRTVRRRLTDFDTGPGGWFIVNDSVMGGRSTGTFTVTDSIMRFDGCVVIDGGGFTSVRRRLDTAELARSARIEMRLRTDGRTYGLMVDDEHRIDGRNVSFRADLDTSGPLDANGWQVVTMPFDSLVPTIHGRVVDAPAFVPDEATEIAIIVADGLDGRFGLDVDWIDACGPG